MGKRNYGRRNRRRKEKRLDDLGLAILWVIGVAIALALMCAILAQLLGKAPMDRGPEDEGDPGTRLVSVQRDSGKPAPAVSAQSAVVMDLVSGRVLYEKNSREKAYPASTTKIMTVLLGLEYGQLDRMVTVADEAVGVEGSSIYLTYGEKLSMEDLLYGAMLRSGNDAATAIAVEISGSVDQFVALMNRRAKEIGAEGTNFANPIGLYENAHYTTAYDMALIARAAMLHPGFEKIAGTKTWTAKRQEGRDPYFYNKNKVVHQYEGGTGVKIGYTKASGRRLAASSEREGRELICVVMNAPDWFNDSYRLMDWAYETYELATIAEGGRCLGKVMVEDGDRETVWVGVKEDVTCLVLPSERDLLGMACAVTKPVMAPVDRGELAGQLHVYASGDYVYSVPLYFLEDVDEVR